MTHELKIWPQHFGAVARRHKNYELRLNDRNYQVGDYLILREFIPIPDHYKGDLMPVSKQYTGKELKRKIAHILTDEVPGLSPGHVILGFTPPPPA